MLLYLWLFDLLESQRLVNKTSTPTDSLFRCSCMADVFEKEQLYMYIEMTLARNTLIKERQNKTTRV